jgi:hypothetical protein
MPPPAGAEAVACPACGARLVPPKRAGFPLALASAICLVALAAMGVSIYYATRPVQTLPPLRTIGRVA